MSPTRARRSASKAKAMAEAAPVAPRPFIAHHLVPPHELLSETETAEVLKELETSLERLPKILMSDPGLKTDPKFLAAREAHEPIAGRLVRIRRPSATAGLAVAYRLLVEHPGE